MSTESEPLPEIDPAADVAQQRAQLFIGGLLIALAALLVYSRVLSAPIVGPDAIHVLNESAYDRIDTALDAEERFGAGPLGGLLFATERVFFGDSPRPYHVVSIFAHIFSALLVFALVRRLLFDRTGEIAPLICGFTFALHPLATSAVNALRFQPALLACLCVLLACEASARVVFSHERYRVVPSALAVIAVAVGIALHPIGYCAAPLALLYDAAVRRGRGMSLTLISHGPLWLITIAALVVQRTIQSEEGGRSILESAAAVPFYLGKALFPLGLSVYYPVLPEVSTAAGIFFFVVLLITVALTLYRGGTVLLGITWILASAFLAVYATDSALQVEEALGYLAIVGVALGLGGLIALITKLPPGTALAGLLGFALVIASGVLTFQRNGDYNAPLFLWGEPATRYPEASTPVFNVGTIHLTQGENILRAVRAAEEATDDDRAAAQEEARARFTEALSFLEAATRLDSDNPLHHYYLGLANFYTNNDARALIALRDTLKLDPFHQQAAIRSGLILQAQADALDSFRLRRDAIDYYRLAAEMAPLPDDIRRRYAAALNANGDQESALAILEGESTSTIAQEAVYTSGILAQDAASLRERLKARALAENNMMKQLAANPSDPNVLAMAAQPMIEQNRFLDATFYLEELLASQPQSSSAWLLLGVARGALGETETFLRDWGTPPPMVDGESPWVRLARACIGSGHGPAAESYLAVEAANDDAPLISAGRLALEMKRFQYAFDVFNRATEAYPERWEPWAGIAAVARQAGDGATADEAAAKARSLGATSVAIEAFAPEPAAP